MSLKKLDAPCGACPNRAHTPSCACVLCEQASASRAQQRNFDMLLGFELERANERAQEEHAQRLTRKEAITTKRYCGYHRIVHMCNHTINEGLLAWAAVHAPKESSMPLNPISTPHDSATALVVSELCTLKTSLETIAGRATPVSAALGKAVSELCFQDADRAHKTEALRTARLGLDLFISGSFFATESPQHIVDGILTELRANRRIK